jgi:hypothetical protein
VRLSAALASAAFVVAGVLCHVDSPPTADQATYLRPVSLASFSTSSPTKEFPCWHNKDGSCKGAKALKKATNACKAGFDGGSKDGVKTGAAMGGFAGNVSGSLAATETGPAGSKLGGMAGGAAGSVLGGAEGWLTGGAGGCVGQAARNH